MTIPLHAVQGSIAYYILHIVDILGASHTLMIACVPLSKRNHTQLCRYYFLNINLKLTKVHWFATFMAFPHGLINYVFMALC